MGKALPVVTFILGAAAGAFTSWQLLKKAYEVKTEAEIESVRKAYQRREENQTTQETMKPASMMATIPKNSYNVVEAAKIMTESHYVPDIPEIPKHDGPYVITPDEFGDFYDYEKVYLMYFADGAIADNEYDILTNTEIEQSIGWDCLNHFGDYEEDVVHVRNDAKHCDYEITKDFRNYSELPLNSD